MKLKRKTNIIKRNQPPKTRTKQIHLFSRRSVSNGILMLCWLHRVPQDGQASSVVSDTHTFKTVLWYVKLYTQVRSTTLSKHKYNMGSQTTGQKGAHKRDHKENTSHYEKESVCDTRWVAFILLVCRMNCSMLMLSFLQMTYLVMPTNFWFDLCFMLQYITFITLWMFTAST